MNTGPSQDCLYDFPCLAVLKNRQLLSGIGAQLFSTRCPSSYRLFFKFFSLAVLVNRLLILWSLSIRKGTSAELCHRVLYCSIALLQLLESGSSFQALKDHLTPRIYPPNLKLSLPLLLRWMKDYGIGLVPSFPQSCSPAGPVSAHHKQLPTGCSQAPVGNFQ